MIIILLLIYSIIEKTSLNLNNLKNQNFFPISKLFFFWKNLGRLWRVRTIYCDKSLANRLFKSTNSSSVLSASVSSFSNDSFSSLVPSFCLFLLLLFVLTFDPSLRLLEAGTPSRSRPLRSSKVFNKFLSDERSRDRRSDSSLKWFPDARLNIWNKKWFF